MIVEETDLLGCFHFTPATFEDERGYFYESFNQKSFDTVVGQHVNFVQDNQSQSLFGVIRGLHLQLGTHAQAKLVRVIQGAILDVAVDLRPHSNTFGEYVSYILSEENKHQLFFPRGFAHGFSVLSEHATIHYKADNFYESKAESGIVYNDLDLKIDWQIDSENILTSDKDILLPTLKEFKKSNG